MSKTSLESPYFLPDYVRKTDFDEFKGDMRNFRYEFDSFRKDMSVFKDNMNAFRDETSQRFVTVDIRMAGIEKRLDDLNNNVRNLRDDMPRYMGVLRDGFKQDLNIAIDFIKGVGDKVDKIADKIGIS